MKLFDLSPEIMGYVETFFGHQDSALSIDSLRNETAVTCGGRDQTCRFWKVAESTQVAFRGGGTSKLRDVIEGAVDGMDEDVDEGKAKGNASKGDASGEKRYVEGSIDCVAMVDESTFVSGGDSGYVLEASGRGVLADDFKGRYLCGQHRRRNLSSRNLWRMVCMKWNPLLRVSLKRPDGSPPLPLYPIPISLFPVRCCWALPPQVLTFFGRFK